MLKQEDMLFVLRMPRFMHFMMSSGFSVDYRAISVGAIGSASVPANASIMVEFRWPTRNRGQDLPTETHWN